MPSAGSLSDSPAVKVATFCKSGARRGITSAQPRAWEGARRNCRGGSDENAGDSGGCPSPSNVMVDLVGISSRQHTCAPLNWRGSFCGRIRQ